VFPQHEIQWIVLAFYHIDTLAGTQILQRLARQFAIPLKLAYRIADIPIGGEIGVAIRLKALDQIEHFRNVLSRPWLVIRPKYSQRSGIFIHGRDKTISQRTDAFTVLLRPANDFVVDVGSVSHIGELQATCPQPARHHIEYHHDPGVAEVAIVVHGHAAHVHASLSRLDGDEGLLFAGQGVIDFQHGRQEVRNCGPRHTLRNADQITAYLACKNPDFQALRARIRFVGA
jgi:hypothetical protein